MTHPIRTPAWSCLLLLACGQPATAPPSATTTLPMPSVALTTHAPSASPATDADSTSASTVPSTEGPSAEPPSAELPPPPARPKGVDAETFDVLASICALATVRDASGELHIGCRSAPPFDKPEELPDGTILELKHVMQFYDVCAVTGFYRGSFSGAGRDEAVIGLSACGADRLNNITPGNVVLVEHSSDGWRVSQVLVDTNVDRCRISKRPDRNLLVCEDGMGAFGAGNLSWRATLDFAAPKSDREQVFSKIFSSVSLSCGHPFSMMEERGVTFVKDIGEKVSDVNGDGYEDLVVTIERAHVDGSAAVVKRAEALCKLPAYRNSGPPLDVLAGKKRRHRLVFKGTPKGMEPNAATKKLLEQWGSKAPPFWWKIK